ncbi:MAG: hypothetical protein LAP87_17570 [Acidobacteriia bacterium]|nr:hypothetical protein [Terriglobia bacterium]
MSTRGCACDRRLGAERAAARERGHSLLLFGVRPHDPAAFAGVVAVLLLASLAAVLAPARRAMKIDPTAALRAE